MVGWLDVPQGNHVMAFTLPVCLLLCDMEELPDGWELAMTKLGRKSEKKKKSAVILPVEWVQHCL